MTALPSLLRRMPVVLYVAAAVFFVWSLANAWIGLSMATTPYMGQEMAGMLNLQKSSMLYSALLDAVYLATYGAIIHVMIALFDQRSGNKEAAE